jgi:hypothetical protein
MSDTEPVHLWARLSQESIACQLEHLARQAETVWMEASSQKDETPVLDAILKTKAVELRRAAQVAAGLENVGIHPGHYYVTRQWEST